MNNNFKPNSLPILKNPEKIYNGLLLKDLKYMKKVSGLNDKNDLEFLNEVFNWSKINFIKSEIVNRDEIYNFNVFAFYYNFIYFIHETDFKLNNNINFSKVRELINNENYILSIIILENLNTYNITKNIIFSYLAFIYDKINYKKIKNKYLENIFNKNNIDTNNQKRFFKLINDLEGLNDEIAVFITKYLIYNRDCSYNSLKIKTGKLYRKLSMYDKSEYYYELALQKDPENYVAMNSLGAVKIDLGKYIEAKKLLLKVVNNANNDKTRGYAYNSMGRLYYELGKKNQSEDYFIESEKHYEKAVELIPRNELNINKIKERIKLYEKLGLYGLANSLKAQI